MLSLLQEKLFKLQDVEYREFQCRLMPTVDPETVIGVRVPLLRRLAKEFTANGQAEDFLNRLPHRYYEENNIHGLILDASNDFDFAVSQLDRFLPYVDNWATCDIISPKIFKKHKTELLVKIKQWLEASHIYTIRFAIKALMSFYLDEDFKPEYPILVAQIRSDEYYVNMMKAWYFATALAKQYDAVIPFIEQKKLGEWTHNKAIRKSIESYRITDEQKAYLRSLQIK